MRDIAEFLRAQEPFGGLDEETLERLADRVIVEEFEAGAIVFKEGRRPRDTVLVLRRGAIELVDGGQVLDVLGEGELIGHPAMVSGLPAGFEARAQEDSVFYAIAASEVVPLLGRRSGAASPTGSLLRRRQAWSGAAETGV